MINDDIQMEDRPVALTNKTSVNEKSSQIRKKFYQAELRLQNDLVEMKVKRMTTKAFDITLSNIVRDEIGKIFAVRANFKRDNHSYFNKITEYTFLLIFEKDYPYTPPNVKLLSPVPSVEIPALCDENGVLNLKCLQTEYWSPVLSLNTILFSIELMLLELMKIDKTDMELMDYYSPEHNTSTNSKFMLNNPSKSPTIIDTMTLTAPRINFNTGKKRKFKEFQTFHEQKSTENGMTVERGEITDDMTIHHQLKMFKQLAINNEYEDIVTNKKTNTTRLDDVELNL